VRRLLGRLALLLLPFLPLAATAQEPARAMFVRMPHNGTAGGAFAENQNLSYLRGIMDKMGWTVDEYEMRQLRTEWIRQAHVPIMADFGNTQRSGVRQYDLVVVWGWRSGQSVNNVFNGTVNIDSLTLGGRWPVKPLVLITCTGLPGNSMVASLASCSTGVTVFFTGLGFPANQPTNLMTAFIPGTDIEWDSWSSVGAPIDYANNTAAHGAGASPPRTGYLRALVGYASAGFIDVANTTDHDGPIPTTNLNAPDTAVVWERGRSSVEPAPIIFAEAALSGGAPDISLWEVALARADSAAGGVLTGSRAGWEPRRIAFGVHGVGFHSENTAAGSGWSFAGYPCYAAKCDSNNFKRFFSDSLGRLARARGAKLSIGYQVDPDTVAVYPNELAWVKAMPAGTWKVYPYNTAGLQLTLGSKSGNGDDPWGNQRSNRTWWDAGLGPPPYTCAPEDTSIYCLIKRENQQAVDAFGAVLGFRYAPESDYFPQGYSRRALPHPDTMGTTLWAAGIRVVAVNVETRGAAPGLTLAPNAPGTLQPEVSNKIWYGPVDGVLLRGWLQGMTERGFVKSVAERGTEFETPITAPSAASHPYHHEFAQGTVTPKWYHADPWPYYHNFRTELSFLSVPAATFTSDPVTVNENPGYWFLKWAINRVAAANYYARRPFYRMVFADEL